MSIKKLMHSMLLFGLISALVGCSQKTELAIPTKVTRNTPVYAAPTAVSILAKVQLAKYSLTSNGAERLLKDTQNGVYFQVCGIFAINSKTAFLFGGFTQQPTGENFRSVLFRTEDGGRDWTEVLQSFAFSEVSHVLFVKNGVGWASIGETSEGLQGTTFWHSSDYGKSWEEIHDVNTGHDDVLGIEFFDLLHGERVLFDGTGNPNRDSVVLETTGDGGNTWDEDFRVYTSGLRDLQNITAAYTGVAGGRYGSHWGTCKGSVSQGCQALGEDGSEWNIHDNGTNEGYLITTQLPGEAEQITYRFPKSATYKDGDWIFNP